MEQLNPTNSSFLCNKLLKTLHILPHTHLIFPNCKLFFCAYLHDVTYTYGSEKKKKNIPYMHTWEEYNDPPTTYIAQM